MPQSSPSNSVPLLLFAIMCMIWGSTWIAIKTGVEAVPPLFFAATRFIAAGILMLAWIRGTGRPLDVHRSDLTRLLAASALTVSATYGFLFWGLQHVDSGLAGVINLSLIPLGMFAIGVAMREERFSLRPLSAIAFGIAGLVILLRPSLAGNGDTTEFLGIIAIIAGTLAYCLGSVMNRPLLRSYPTVLLSGLATLIGGLLLLALALVLEPVTIGTFAAYWRMDVIASWLFLVLFGSLVAFTIFLRLLRDWGPARASTYGFVSPLVAVIIGITVNEEQFGLAEAMGSILLILAARLALGGQAQGREPVRATRDHDRAKRL